MHEVNPNQSTTITVQTRLLHVGLIGPLQHRRNDAAHHQGVRYLELPV